MSLLFFEAMSKLRDVVEHSFSSSCPWFNSRFVADAPVALLHSALPLRIIEPPPQINFKQSIELTNTLRRDQTHLKSQKWQLNQLQEYVYRQLKLLGMN